MAKGIDAMTAAVGRAGGVGAVRGWQGERPAPGGPERRSRARYGAAHGLRGALALILLSGALATGACTLPEDGTPLHTAALNSNPSVIKALIEGGANPGARDDDGATPLHMAAGETTNPSVIKALIEAGANPGARGAGGNTPLHTAAGWNANPSVILALIEADANPLIARCGLLGRVIPALIEGGANPGVRDAAGATPLHTAAGNNTNPSVILALIECGADPGARDYDGFTPFDYAKENEALKGTEAYWLLYEALFE